MISTILSCFCFFLFLLFCLDELINNTGYPPHKKKKQKKFQKKTFGVENATKRKCNPKIKKKKTTEWSKKKKKMLMIFIICTYNCFYFKCYNFFSYQLNYQPLNFQQMNITIDDDSLYSNQMLLHFQFQWYTDQREQN